MRNTHKIVMKKEYFQPRILRIALDNEISLVLESDSNPLGEPEWSQATELINNTAFKNGNA